MTADLVRTAADGDPDRWDDPERGTLSFRTLFSQEVTGTSGLTAGVAEVQPGDEFKPHRHPQTEVYLVLGGEGLVRIGDDERAVQTGSTIFLPADRVHGVLSTGDAPLRLFYVLAADGMEDVDYRFE